MTDGPPPDPSRVAMVGVGLLAGGVTALVLSLLAGAANVVTPLAVPLDAMAGAAGVAGLAVAADGARQPSPSAVIVRCSTVVAILLLIVGLALGGYAWIRLDPAARQQGIGRYAPAVPIVLGGLLAFGVGFLGRLFDRHRRRRP